MTARFGMAGAGVADELALLQPAWRPRPAPTTRRLIALPLGLGLLYGVQAFDDLQELRNEADYNLDRQWNRLDLINTVQIARQAFADGTAIRATPTAAVFEAALLLQRHWGRS